MNKSTIIRTLINFDCDLFTYADTISKFYFSNYETFTKSEKEDIFEGYLLRISALWEKFIEDVIIDCFNQNTSKFSDFTGFKIDKHLNRDTCKAILIGVGYLDFKSSSDIISFSKKILVENKNPFPKVSKSAWKKIDEFLLIRNYLAHESDRSKRTLQRMYRENYGVNKFIKPGKFLMTNFDQRGHALGRYMDSMDWIAKEIDSFLGLFQKFYLDKK